jgi:hypothetical protein
MEQKTKNMIRVILVLFLFGLMITASGISLALKGLNFEGVIGLCMAVAGVSCLALGVLLVKNKW